MHIIDFLQARLTEDELTAHAAFDTAPEWHTSLDFRDIKDGDGFFVVQADARYPSLAQAEHIARHDPARVLRSCEALRAVIAEYLRRVAIGDVHGAAAVEGALQLFGAAYGRGGEAT